MSRVPYALVVGNLMYAMIFARPNIAQAVGVIGTQIHMVDPSREHWSTMKRIFRYIKGTSGVALYFEGSKFIVKGYVDSNFCR